MCLDLTNQKRGKGTDENPIFLIEAILKQTSSLYGKKNAVYRFQISLRSRDVQVLKICKFSQVMMSYILNQILIKYD